MYSISLLIFLVAGCNIVYGQYDWSYTEQAYTKEGQPCVTDCVAGMCYIDWEYTRGECVKYGVKPPRYRTRKGTYCVSNCGYFGTYYDWCATGRYYREWEQCNSSEENVSVYRKKCEGPCTMGQNGYYWCKVANSWQYCAPPREGGEEITEPPFQ